MEPESGLMIPAMFLINVVFPQPLGPITEMYSPFRIVREILSLAIILPYFLVKPTILTSGNHITSSSFSKPNRGYGNT
jgi:hypothetical protein